MTAKLKLAADLNSAGNMALDDVTPRLYDHLGMKIVGVVEFTAIERNEIAADEKGDPWVKLRVSGIEVARGDGEQVIRDAMRAMRIMRTAHGTLTEEFDVQLADKLVENLRDNLTLAEAARLRAGAVEFAHYAQQAVSADLTVEGLRAELKRVADGLYQLGTMQ